MPQAAAGALPQRRRKNDLLKGGSCMQKLVLGFIGFGEAAFHISDGLRESSRPVIKAYSRPNPATPERAQKAGVELVDSLAGLIAASDFVLCTTSAKVALPIAQEAASHLVAGKVYADLNSTSPMMKREIAQVIAQSGAVFVDVAVLEAVPSYKHRVPILASGNGARQFADAMCTLGMNVRYMSDMPGKSSSLKVFRSIVIKGIASVLLEALIAGHEEGVVQQLMDSITETFTKNTPEQLANMFLNRTAVTASRRVSEMRDVVETLKELGLESFSTQGTIKRLEWVCDIGLKDRFDGKVPQHYTQVLKAISDITHE